MTTKPKIIKCRGIIVANDKMLLARHSHNNRDFYAFLGGHLEGDENPVECAERELTEELGIEPRIGRLVYVNHYSESDKDYLEFFFEVLNGKDYIDIKKFKGTHSHELIDVRWVGKEDIIDVLPKVIFEDFKNNRLASLKEVVFI